ncbi:MAG: hypothetical protein QXT34_01330 [Candidatus Aenigmatarchaeota archaeon]
MLVASRKLLECIASSLLDANFYWRNGNREIDFILKNNKLIPIEIKSIAEIEFENF